MSLLNRLGRGLEAGGLAGCGVAVLFLATDVVRLAPLRTVAELARPFGATSLDPESGGFTVAALAAAGAAVVLYSLLHFGAFGLLGVLATWVVPGRTFWTTLGRGAVFGAVACSGVFVVGRAAVGSSISLDAVGPVGLLLANAMAGVIMAAVLAVHTHDTGDAATG
ncbi:MAG: hypothetical protein RLN75_09270 [Longimicrobiales bacterium]